MKVTKLVLVFLFFGVLYAMKNDYYLTKFEYLDEKQTKLEGELTYKNEEGFNPDEYEVNFQNKTSYLLVPITKLKLEVNLECGTMLHIKITDFNKKRWEVPYSISDEYKAKVQTCVNEVSLAQFGFTFETDPTIPFTFSLTDQTTKEVLYDTKSTNFLFTDNFILFGGMTTSNDIYGFGERYHSLKLGDGIFTMWPNDTAGIREDLGNGGYNAMGIHPLGFHKSKKNNLLGMLFNNINAQDLYIKTLANSTRDNNVLVEHRTIGGIIDYYFDKRTEVDELLKNLHEVIGNPILPPFWSLGYHQCRWGYNNDGEISELLHKFIANDFPIDTMWGDIDILQDKRIFTLNMQNFSGLPQVIEELHNKGMNFVPIVDIGFPVNESDQFYVKGKETNAFILSNYTHEHMVSHVWPGPAVFTDYFTKQGEDLWEYGMSEYYKIVKYDGIWIDMNEPAMISPEKNNRGELLPSEKDFDPEKNRFEYIPYIPGYRPPIVVNIVSHTMSENAISTTFQEDNFLISYNFKPCLSLLQSFNTGKYLKALDKRPFILSRSTMIGSGKHNFHWLGDNGSSYKDMRNGVNGIFQFQIYGIPFAGDDICGFNGNTNDKLCSRWMSLGAFFPFSRNHNSIGNIPQDPFAFGEDSYTFKSSKIAMYLRYSLLRYFYTELFLISQGKSGSFFKPAFFEFLNDSLSYKYIDSTVLVGNALYLVPAFTDDTDIPTYFPNADFNDFRTGEIVKTYDPAKLQGTEEHISISFQDIKLYIRGGYIVPRQETISPLARNTHDLRKRKTQIIIHPDSQEHSAEGDIIFDDDSVNTLETKNYLQVKMKFSYNKLKLKVKNDFISEYPYEDINISGIILQRIGYLHLDNTYYAKIEDINGKIYKAKIDIIQPEICQIDLTNYSFTFKTVDTITIEKQGFLQFLS